MEGLVKGNTERVTFRRYNFYHKVSQKGQET